MPVVPVLVPIVLFAVFIVPGVVPIVPGAVCIVVSIVPGAELVLAGVVLA